jgi:hypothetical protein
MEQFAEDLQDEVADEGNLETSYSNGLLWEVRILSNDLIVI